MNPEHTRRQGHSDIPLKVQKWQAILLVLPFLRCLLPGAACAQVVDTVCLDSPLAHYHVIGQPGSSYKWMVQGGGIIGPESNDSITILWDTVPGIYPLSLIQYSEFDCTDTVTAYIRIEDSLYLRVYPDSLTVCEGEKVVFHAESNGVLGWSGGYSSDSVVITAWSPGSLTAFAANTCGNESVTVKYDVIPRPSATFWYRPEQPATGDIIQFTPLVHPGWTYTWVIFGEDTISQPMLTYQAEAPGEKAFLLVVSSDSSTVCVDSARATIWIYDDMVLWVANAFTPNGDGLNDLFQVKASVEDLDYSIVIYDRWGEECFSSSDIHQSWDGTYQGKDCPADVYAYKILYSRAALAQQGARHMKSGMIVLVR